MKFAQLKAQEILSLNELKFEKESDMFFCLNGENRELLILIFRIRTRNDLTELENSIVKFVADLIKICREQEDYEECDRLNRVQIVMTHIIDEEIRDRKLQEI